MSERHRWQGLLEEHTCFSLEGLVGSRLGLGGK